LGLCPTLWRTFKYNKYKFKVGTYSEIVTVSMGYNLLSNLPLPMFLGFDKLLQGNLCLKDIDSAMFHTTKGPYVSDMLPK
jgi:hypothetical protein